MDIPIAYKKQILFVGLFGIVIYFGYNEDLDSVTNYKRGLLAAAFVLVSQGILNQYTGPFTRRFPRFWRGVSRYTIIYLAILIFILYQTAQDARGLMKHLYPELGKPVTRGMHTYDDDCDLNLPNFIDNLDHYYAMHLVGWFVSALMVRDVYILHFWSILDEVLELSWQHILPHFRECWWDHILVDLLLSNTPAIYLGMYFIKKTGLREFDWLGRKGKKSIKEWDVFYNHRRLGCFMSFFLVMSSNFLGGFFIINSLWIPPKNFINVYRLSVWFLLGSIAIGELYDDVDSWGTPQRLTTPISNEFRWICCGVTILECLISYKFRHDTGNIMDVPTPWYISVPWILVTGGTTAYYLYLRFIKKNRTTKGGDSEWEIEERRKKSTRLAEKEKKLKAKAETESKGESQPKQVKNAPETQVTETANGKAKKQAQADQKKQADTKAQPAPVKAAEPTKKAVAPQDDDDDEWKVAGGSSKGGKQQQQQQKPQKQQKKRQQEESEEEREEEPVRHEPKAPVEDEWKEIKSVKAIKKANKKKWE